MAVNISIPSGALLLSRTRVVEAIGQDVFLDKNNLEAAVDAILGEIGVTSITVGEGEAQTGDVTIDLEALGLENVDNLSAESILALLERATVETLLGNTGYTTGGSVKGIIDQIKDNATKIAALQEAIGQDEDGNSLTERVAALETDKLDASAFTAQAVENLIEPQNAQTGKVSARIKNLESAIGGIDDIKEVLGDIDNYDEDDVLTRLSDVETNKLNASALNATAIETLLNANHAVDGTIDTRLDKVEAAVEEIDDKLDESEFTAANIEAKLNSGYNGSNGVDTRLSAVEATAATVKDKMDKSAFTAEAVEKLINATYSGSNDGVDARLKAVEAKAASNESALDEKLESTDITSDMIEGIINASYVADGKVDARIRNLVAKDSAQDAIIEGKVSETDVTTAYVEGKLGFTSWTGDADGATSLKSKLEKMAAKIQDTSDVDEIKSDLEELAQEIEKDYWKKEDLDGAAIEEILGFSVENGDDKISPVVLSMSKWTTDGDFKKYELSATDLGVTELKNTDDYTLVLSPSATLVQATAAAECAIVKGDVSDGKLAIFSLKVPSADLPVLVRIDVH